MAGHLLAPLGDPFDLATTLASALAVIGVCLVAARALPRSVALLSGAGAMSLTTYSLHATALSKWAWPPWRPGAFGYTWRSSVAWARCSGWQA